MTCVFCRIVESAEPCHKIYEDEHVLAFLDHRPVREGTTLLIPKYHYDHFIDMPDDVTSHIGCVARDIGKRMMDVLSPKTRRIGLAIHGFGVNHVHYIIVPMDDPNDITSGVFANCNDSEVQFNHLNVPIQPFESLQRVATILKFD